jgi:hypothetical protein
MIFSVEIHDHILNSQLEVEIIWRVYIVIEKEKYIPMKIELIMKFDGLLKILFILLGYQNKHLKIV